MVQVNTTKFVKTILKKLFDEDDGDGEKFSHYFNIAAILDTPQACEMTMDGIIKTMCQLLVKINKGKEIDMEIFDKDADSEEYDTDKQDIVDYYEYIKDFFHKLLVFHETARRDMFDNSDSVEDIDEDIKLGVIEAINKSITYN